MVKPIKETSIEDAYKTILKFLIDKKRRNYKEVFVTSKRNRSVFPIGVIRGMESDIKKGKGSNVINYFRLYYNSKLFNGNNMRKKTPEPYSKNVKNNTGIMSFVGDRPKGFVAYTKKSKKSQK